MNQNPYAPPGAAVPAAPVPFGQPQPWSTSEALTLAWERFKVFAPVLVLAYLLNMVFAFIAGQIGNVPKLTGGLHSPALVGVLALASFLVGQAVAAFLEGGMMRIVLDAARGRAPVLGTLFAGGDRFVALFCLNLLMVLALVPAFFLLIVPGVILALGWSLAPFYVVDAGMGPIEAMKASWSATRGQKGEIFVLGIASVGLTLLGVLMCCVGVLATSPILYVAFAIAFIRMSGLGVVATLPGASQQPPLNPPF